MRVKIRYYYYYYYHYYIVVVVVVCLFVDVTFEQWSTRQSGICVNSVGIMIHNLCIVSRLSVVAQPAGIRELYIINIWCYILTMMTTTTKICHRVIQEALRTPTTRWRLR